MRKGSSSKSDHAKAFEDGNRRAFTKTWNEGDNTVETLPIKVRGRVIKTSRILHSTDEVAGAVISADESSEVDLQSSLTNEIAIDDDNLDSIEADLDDEVNCYSAASTSLIHEDSRVAKTRIAEICMVVTGDPEAAVKKRKHGSDEDEIKLSDLFLYFHHPSCEVIELAILSAVVVFKDILPGYRIRLGATSDPDLKLKKETKKIQDFESLLLAAYQKFLKFLENKISIGLGSIKSTVKNLREDSVLLGITCLRAECELLLAIPFFNFRSILLKTVVNRMMQQSERISSICCDTIKEVFTRDIDCELSYECVRSMGTALNEVSYNVFPEVIQCLELVKVRVHADEAKNIRKKAKQERRKRRRIGDDVDAGLLEANGANESNIQRYQADSLHELCLIYFRILKKKIGFKLLPVALQGLGRITHLINMDTVEDLIAVMRSLIESCPAPPIEVKLNCVYCVLRTLTGPGEELMVDDEVFISTLSNIIVDAPATFSEWGVIISCIELCLISRRETRIAVCKRIVRSVFSSLATMPSSAIVTSMLLVQKLMLRYPQLRNDFQSNIRSGESAALQGRKIIADDSVADFAMIALRKQDSEISPDSEVETNSSWILNLLRFHCNHRVRTVANSFSKPDSIPIPYRPDDANENILLALDSSLQGLQKLK